MHKDNRWVHGKREFAAPALPDNLKGVTGCLFQEAIFDPKIGSEYYLAILEESDYCETLGSLESINLFCTTGVGRTNNGVVAFLIFSLSDITYIPHPKNMKAGQFYLQ